MHFQLRSSVDDHGPATEHPRQALTNESANALQIYLLLIEDNPGDVRLVQEMLRDAPDIKVQSVNRLAQAIAYVAAHKTDVVLLDLGLPDSRGLDTLRTLAGWAPTVPIVVLTGQGDDEIGRAAVREGAQDYLEKGFIPERMLARVLRFAVERKRGEEALRESETRYKDLVEKSRIGILIDDREGRIKYANRTFAEMFGYSAEEIVRLSMPAIIAPDDLERIIRIHRRRMDGHEDPSRYEFKGLRKNGSLIYCEVDAVELKEGEEVVGSRSYIWDISERKKIGEALDIERERLKTALKKLEKAMRGTIEVVAAAVEMRDPYTAGHQRKVAQLAGRIAGEMGFAKDHIDGILMAGIIHDLGKIAVPAEILSKPGTLTKDEFALIEKHPQIGFDILKPIEFPWPVAQLVLQHHERMDGSGYPHGLSGENILMGARILAVADVVEAMSSHRPYRPALGVDIALAEIQEHSGAFYDPEVVKACVKLFRENKYKFE